MLHSQRLCRAHLLAAALFLTAGIDALRAADPVPPAAAPAPADDEKVWGDLSKMPISMPQPEEWKTKPPTEEQFHAWIGSQIPGLRQGAALAGDFLKRYPQSAHATEAAELEFQFLNRAAMFGDKASAEQRDLRIADRLKDPSLPIPRRQILRTQQIMIQAREAMGRGNPGEIRKAYEDGGRALLKEFPADVDAGYGLLFTAASQFATEAAGRALANEIMESNATDQMKVNARGLIRRLDAIGKPLDLKFTALDGRAVDVQAMKGKVVLIDFWATWCAPCVAEMPAIKATYEKLHGKGFEIVGLSFDNDKEALEQFVKEKELPWPQHFETEGPKSRYSVEYAVVGIPTMWLVDKRGILRDQNAREGLVEKIALLLAE